MVDINKRHIVEHIEVLAWIAATHNHQAGSFGSRLDAGQLLCRLDDVGAIANGGQLVNAFGIQGQGVEGLAFNASGIDFDGLQSLGQRLQTDLQRLVGMVHLEALFFIAYA